MRVPDLVESLRKATREIRAPLHGDRGAWPRAHVVELKESMQPEISRMVASLTVGSMTSARVVRDVARRADLSA